MEKVELDTKHITLRYILFAVCCIIAILAIWYTVSHMLSTEKGWQRVTVNSTDEMSISGDLTFYYNIGESGKAPRSELRELSSLYTESCAKAWKIVSTTETYDGVGNLASINTHPNEEVTVDEDLYQVLTELKEADALWILYYAPCYELLDSVAAAESDEEAKLTDPVYSEDAKEIFEEVVALAKDENNISLELLGDCKVKLNVSAAYMEAMSVGASESAETGVSTAESESTEESKATAECEDAKTSEKTTESESTETSEKAAESESAEESKTTAESESAGASETIVESAGASETSTESTSSTYVYIDFGWLRNAVAVEIIADAIIEGGYNYGMLSSKDGFVRLFDDSESTFQLSLPGRTKDRAVMSAQLSYSGHRSLVLFSVVPFLDTDTLRMYDYANGDVRTTYVGRDGSITSAAESLVAYDENASLVTLAAKYIEVFMGEALSTTDASVARIDGAQVIWTKDAKVYYTDEDAELVNLYENDGIVFEKVLVK